MRSPQILNPRADWIQLVEAMNTPGEDERSWANAVRDAAEPLFPDAMVVGFYLFEYALDFSSFEVGINLPASLAAMFADMKEFTNRTEYLNTWVPFHFSGPVATFNEISSRIDARAHRELDVLRKTSGYGDGVAMLAHPRPGLISVIHGVFDSEEPITLKPHERQLLSRIALHLEASHRVRCAPEKVHGELSARGELLWREPKAPPSRLLEGHVGRIAQARSAKGRKTSDAVDLWAALVAGRASLVPRREGTRDRYLVLENEPVGSVLRAFTPGESAVLDLVAKGVPTKVVAYGQGISSSAVSNRLASAAAKLGVMSRNELVRVAAMLMNDERARLPDADLTAAEEEILVLLQRGLTNRQIASTRARSVRTIANQVANLLKKTRSSSRRELVTRVAE